MIMWMKRWLKILLLFVVVIILSMLVITQRLSSTINSYQSEQSGRSEARNVTAINSNQSKQKRTIQRTDTSKMKNQHKHIARKNYRNTCTVIRLKNRLRGKINGMTQCKKHPFLSRDCYSNFYNPYAIDIEGACRKPGAKEFCSITGTPDQWGVRCNITSCGKKVYIGTKKVDRINWKEYGNKEDLQKSIANLIQSSTTRFCFISCFTLHSHGFEPQILNLPPPPQRTSLKTKRKSHREQKHMNLNFIMIDSVSRVHFFRSLQRSVKALNQITTEHEDAMVLDFELVQGIRSRTFETLQALFSGYVNPYEVPFGINDLSKEKLNVAKWLLSLRELDFSSLWLEDMCPFTGWGLSRDLLVVNRTLDKQSFYMKFLDTCRKVGIDDIGNTLASCNILKSNGMSNPFNSKTICYNGRHHHSYLFSYLKMFQRTMHHRSKPFISYMTSNIAHELGGKRNQYIDSDLAEYLKFSSAMYNTLTIVFSDHGNTYRDSQGRNSNRVLEVFNPFLFMIIPKAVQSMLTANQMQALKINQNRLISLLDLHYTISYIIRLLHNGNNSETSLDNDVNDFNKQFNVSEEGLLTEISASRTCSIMPRIMPNICICKGYDVSSKDQSYDFILAVYSVSMMNNNIQQQLANSGGSVDRTETYLGGFKNCKRMKVQKIKNVAENRENNSTKTMKMDLYVETDGQTVDEFFFISVMIKDFNVSRSRYERVTPYGKYSSCSDKDVEAQLCICNDLNERDANTTALNISSAEYVMKSILYSNLHHNVTSINVDGDACLYVIEQFNESGIVYDSFNDCNTSLTLRLLFRQVNINISTANTVDVNLSSGDIKFLAAGVSNKKWSCSVNVDVKV